MGYFETLFQKEAMERSSYIGNIDFSQVALEDVIDQVVDIEVPEGDPEVKEMTGPSLDETVRKEPITAHVDLRGVLKTSSSAVAGVSIPNPYLKGVVLLLLFASIALPRTTSVRPEQALTYGVAWNLTEQGVLPVQKDQLLESVSRKSGEIEDVDEIDQQSVLECIDTLDEMGCITIDNSSDGSLIWLNEKFSVEYQV